MCARLAAQTLRADDPQCPARQLKARSNTLLEAAGARAILEAIRKRWPWVKHLFDDGAYDRGKLSDKAALAHFVIKIVRRIEGTQGFYVLPRRWVVDDALAPSRARL
jgi:hypothetical protein